MNAGDVLETKTFTVTRADLVAYADASGDHNPIHQDEDVARSVGLPGVIAHGMYTLALVGRAVAEWTGGAEVVDLGGEVHQPRRRTRRGRRRGGRRRHREVGRRRPGHARARGDVRGQEGARHAQGRGARGHRPCLTCATTPPCAWVAPAASGCAPPPRPSSSPRWRDADAAGTPVLVLGGRLQPRRRRRGLRRPGRRGRDHRRRRRHRHLRRRRPRPCGGVVLTVAAGEDWDDLVAHAVEQGLGGHRGALRHPGRRRRDPDPERRRLRPGRRPDHRPVRTWDRVDRTPAHLRRRRLRLRLPPQPLQGRARALRRARGDLPAAAGRPVRAVAVRRAGPHPRRRSRRARPAAGRARRGAGAALAARAWCSTPTTTTRGAPGRSSPTRS